MAVSGHNGNNETKIGFSNSIGLSIYDEKLNEIKISNLKSPIDLIIQRDSNLPKFPYQYVNATQIQLSNDNFLLPSGIHIASQNASLHIELKPIDFTLGYLITMKLGQTPLVTRKTVDYTSFKIFCPSN